MRKDAARNRGKLIEAAREVMREAGGDVPFETIAELAGVTRGTLYRNFADRQALYEVVLEYELEIMKAKIEALPDEDSLGFLVLMAEMMMVYDKFLSVFPSLPDYKQDGLSEARISAVIAAPLARAQERGVLRADLGAYDMQIASRMLAANWRMDLKPSRSASLNDRLAMFMRGLGGGSAR